MGKETEIAWCTHTFNPWWGCARVSPGCEHCYAESFAKRTGHGVWGTTSPRRFFKDKHWKEPVKWDEEAKAAGERRRVFCASMSDVFEDRDDLLESRARLTTLVAATPHLDWLILTKRPQHARRLWTIACGDGHGPCVCGAHGRSKLCGDISTATGHWASNIWLGTTAEDQQRADERIPYLLEAPALVRFLSCEPLLGPVDLFAFLRGKLRDESLAALRSPPMPGVDWVIVGGESGAGARTMEIGWARAIVEQCSAHKTACFVKQMGHRPIARSRFDMGAASFKAADDHGWTEHAGPVTLLLKHSKGGDPEEWAEELRVRQFPISFPRP